MPPGNLAARAGRRSAHHRKRAILGWLAFVIVAFALGSATGTKELEPSQYGVGESGRADKTVDDAFPDQAAEQVLVQSRENETARDPEFQRAVDDVVNRVEGVRYVVDVKNPYDRDNQGQISADGKSALVTFNITGKQQQTEERVDGTLAAVAGAEKQHPGFRIEEFGDASAAKEIGKRFEDDFRKAEITSVPITLTILFFAFGALVAAGVPLLLAITAVMAALGLIGPVSQIWAVDQSIASVVLLIGLAVGIDYSMFYLRREREERAGGRSEEAALEAAAATSGRAVMVSGVIVVIAMAGMYIAGASTFTSFATGTILVVSIAVIGSLTVLPAVLSKLGDRVNKGRLPGLHPERRTGETRFWGRILDPVLRHPVVSVILAGGLLAVLAIPTLHIHTRNTGVSDLPRDLAVMQTYDRIQKAFPGGPLPATVVVKADDVTGGRISREIERLKARGERELGKPVTIELSPGKDVAQVSIPLRGDGADDESLRGLDKVRNELVPATVGRVPDTTADVTGMAASSKDFNDLMKERIPFVFLFVLGLAFVLLLVTFRSIVIPIKAILLNLLSVAAAYGIVTWGFQDGHLESLMDFESNGAVTAWLPLFLFVVLFGLSMDYHVFILTRIREAYDRGMTTEQAVEHGIKTTASVVTAAAIVMVAVFAIFATLSSIEFKQFGIGLSSAVLIDATIVRAVLLPATMKLLGDWNWYLPKWLEWLPHVSPAEPPADVSPPQAEAVKKPEPAEV
jgi:RND superfamily putative drug exporter